MTSNHSQINSIDGLLSEVRHLFLMMYPNARLEMFDKAFHDIINLFNGGYEGYKACNTPFHDLQHTLDCLLAMIRILHGASIENIEFTPKETELGLIAALMHDTGYIQTLDDVDGTGAKYTLIHVKRSGKFLKEYFEKNGYSNEAIQFCLGCINYTGLGREIDAIQGKGDVQDVMGQMLGTADLVGQMSDHSYLEKLLYLAQEFKEGNVPGYEDEDDLLRKTKGFYLHSRQLLKNEYGCVVKYLKSHFECRWNINKNVYLESIHKQIDYLEHIIAKYPEDFKKHLKRK